MKLKPTNEAVTIKWFAWSNGERFPMTSQMRGVGYDAQCSCGWGTQTGGAIMRCVKEAIQNHKWIEHGYRYEKAGA